MAVAGAGPARAQLEEPPILVKPNGRPLEDPRDVPAVAVDAFLSGPIPSPTQALAVRCQARGDLLRSRGDAACVDAYYRAVVVAFACIQDEAHDPGSAPLAQAVALYNTNLALCLHSASSFGRLRPSSHLEVDAPAGRLTVPIRHAGFLWIPDDFSALIDPATAGTPPPGPGSPGVRSGLGARTVALRYSRPGAPRDFLSPVTAIPVTAVLEPDLDAWLGLRDGPPADRLIFLDPLRVSSVEILGRAYRLAADPGAGLALWRQINDPDQLRVDGFLRPSSWGDRAGVYALEPYQPGKIPVVFVHGLASSPWTWAAMIGSLRADPDFLDRYQIWVFSYPTGVPFLQSGALLRESLLRAVDTFDPDGDDPALRRMVLVGHSMGGLLCKLQISESGDRVWSTFSTVSYEAAVIAPEARAAIERSFFFEPLPVVERVIFIATPHRGSHVADAVTGRLASSLVRPPDNTRAAFEQFKRDNPGALRRSFTRLPNSVDLLRQDNDLLKALLTLPRLGTATYHTIAGVGKPDPTSGEASDGVVPLASARLSWADSELLVPATHNTIHRHRATIGEVRKLLDEHYRGGPARPGGRGALATRPPARAEPKYDPATAPAGYLPEPP
jgi:hypothetical protein